MAKRSKEVRARMSAAAKKRWAKKATVTSLISPIAGYYDPVTKTNGLVDRMTQAIDKIETQIKRLESL